MTAPGFHARESADQCVVRAQARGDDLIGSAFVQSRMLLVEQPGPWGHNGLRESHFSRSVAVALEDRAARAGLKVLAIRRPGRTVAGAARHWAIADCGLGTERVVWGTYDADDDLLSLPLDGSAGSPDPAPVFLVCAHSKRDRCCAVRGRPVAAALEEARPGRVWECSHTGGHRFAANVLALPTGLLYGRIQASDVPTVLDVASRGAVLPGRTRGRVGLPPTGQAAVLHALTASGREHWDDYVMSRLSDGVVDLTGPDGTVSLRVREERVPVAGLSCGDFGAEHTVRFVVEPV